VCCGYGCAVVICVVVMVGGEGGNGKGCRKGFVCCNVVMCVVVMVVMW
jgi:hypothetical protein